MRWRRDSDATWAIWSKTPGKTQGYQIESARSDSGTAGHLVTLAAGMGTPKGWRAGFRDELPWLTFTGGEPGGEPMVAIASFEWSGEQDGTSQSIMPARLVWLPWATVTDRMLDHSSLWSGVQALRWPEVDGGPQGASGFRVAIAAGNADRDRTAVDITRQGFDYLAQIAAHLVDGSRVAIVLGSGDAVSVAERVRFLDAVLGLLPFGARNCLTVATWARYDVTQCAVLTFSDGVQPDQIHLPWSGDYDLVALGARGQDYLNELKRIAAEGYTVAEIVDHLATSTKPLQHIGDVTIDVLSELRFSSVVYDEVRRGVGTVDRVHRALQQRRSPVHVEAFVQFLADSACSQDGKTAKQASKVIVAEWDKTLAVVLGDLCRDGQRQADQVLTWLELSKAAEKKHDGAISAYVAHALQAPQVQPDDVSMAALAGLVVHYLASEKSIAPGTYRCLVNQPHVLVRVLAEMVRPKGKLQSAVEDMIKRLGGTINGALRVLERHSGAKRADWLEPILLAARGKAGDIDARDVDTLAELGPEAVRCLLDLLLPQVGVSRSIEIGWPAVTRLLNGRGVEPTADLVRGLLSAPNDKQEEPAEVERARLDVLGLLVEGKPCHQDLAEAASDDYFAEFSRALSELDEDLAAGVTGNLFGHLHSRLDSVPPEVVQRLDEALGVSLTEQYLDLLARWLQQGYLHEVLRQNLPVEWRTHLEEHPGLEWFRSLGVLDTLVREGGDVADVLGQAISALRGESADSEVSRILSAYATRADPGAMDELLTSLRTHDVTGEHVATQVRDHLRTGECGSEPAQNFVKYTSEKYDRYAWLSGSRPATEGYR